MTLMKSLGLSESKRQSRLLRIKRAEKSPGGLFCASNSLLLELKFFLGAKTKNRFEQSALSLGRFNSYWKLKLIKIFKMSDQI